MSVENHIIKVSFCGTFQKAIKPNEKIMSPFLLYDFVHLLKNIRNLWLTEKSCELFF